MTTDKRVLRIYYAHPMSWYNHSREASDVLKLAEYGEVTNPNSAAFEREVQRAKGAGEPVMQIFADYIRNFADVVAFRRFDGDFKLGAGVAREVLEARIWCKSVWEIYGPADHLTVNKLPTVPGQFDLAGAVTFGDVLTVEETTARIKARRL